LVYLVCEVECCDDDNNMDGNVDIHNLGYSMGIGTSNNIYHNSMGQYSYYRMSTYNRLETIN